MVSSQNVARKYSRNLVLVLMVGLLALALAACGEAGTQAVPTTATGGNTGTTEATATVPSSGGTIDSTPATGTGAATDTTPTGGDDGGNSAEGQEVELTEWAVKVDDANELQAGKVTFTVQNEGQFTHNAVVLDSNLTELGRTPNFKKGEGPKVLEVDLQPGTYTMLCDIQGHPEKGMVTQFTVK